MTLLSPEEYEKKKGSTVKLRPASTGKLLSPDEYKALVSPAPQPEQPQQTPEQTPEQKFGEFNLHPQFSDIHLSQLSTDDFSNQNFNNALQQGFNALKQAPTSSARQVAESKVNESLPNVFPQGSVGDKILTNTGKALGIGALLLGGGEVAAETGGRLGANLLSKIAPNAPKIVSTLARGLGTGAAFGAGSEGLDAELNPNSQSLAQRLKNIGIDTALGGAGDVGLSLAGKGLKFAGTKLGQSITNFFKGTKPEAPQASEVQGILSLPPASQESIARYNKINGNVLPANTEPIYGHGDIYQPEPIGLPEAKLSKPTTARTFNPAKDSQDLLNRLNQEVNSRIARGQIKPVDNVGYTNLKNEIENGYKNGEISQEEYTQLHDLADQELQAQRNDFIENVKSVYGEIAPKNAPKLSTLIDESYRPPKPVPADLIKKAKLNQQSREVAGVQLPVKSVSERFTEATGNKLGQTGIPVEPQTVIGFNKKAPLKERLQSVSNDQTLKTAPLKERLQSAAESEPIPEEIIQTKEPRVRDKVVNFFDEAEQAARDRLRAKRNTLSSNPLDQYKDYAIIGASYLVKGAVKFSDWSAKMIQEFGEEIKPHLKSIFDLSKKNIKEAEREANGVAHLPGVNAGVDPLAGSKSDIGKLEDALEHSGAWRDKNRFLLNRETMERNFEDVMGKDADIMNKTYIEPVQKSAAERQRFITKERKEVKGLGIKYKSAEDELVQVYGEEQISLEELKQISPKNWQQIKKSAETLRNKYDELLDKANTVLRRNGYPEIPRRKNYFPHYQEIDGLLKKLGFGFEDQTLPAELNGRTADFKPGKNYFSHALERKGSETTLGALEGFDRYIEGISKVIYQTDNIKRLRGLDKFLRDKHEIGIANTHLSNFVANLTDYINILAGKRTELDRSLEAGFGRNINAAVDTIKRRVGANMIGGSISSALTNSIPVTQLVGETSKGSVLRGLESTLRNIKGEDSIGKDSDFLARRFHSHKLSMSKLDKAQNIAAIPFQAMDHFISNVVIRSRYYEGIKKGLTPKQSLKAADKYATRMMADRSEGSVPNLFHSRSYGLITQFQLEVNNQLSHLFKDIPKGVSKKKYIRTIGEIFIYDHLYNLIYKKITGNQPAFDPIGVIIEAIQDYTNPRLSTQQATKNLVYNVSNQLPFVSTFTGGGRIPLTAALPNVFGENGLIKGSGNFLDRAGKESLKPLTYVLPPFGGSQVKKTIQGLSALIKGGAYRTNSKGEKSLQYPIKQSPANILRGTLFGKNALPETQNFYRNNIPALTPAETQQFENTSKGKQEKIYKDTLIDKRLRSLKAKESSIQKNTNLSPSKKQEQIKKIVDQYIALLNQK